MKKTYKYYVSFAYNCERFGLGTAYLTYDEPIDTEDMIERATRDIKRINGCNDVTILFFKRIEDNR